MEARIKAEVNGGKACTVAPAGSLSLSPGGGAGLLREDPSHLQEAELIRNIQELLKRTMGQAVGQIRWVTAAAKGPEGWTSLNSVPKAGLRWEAGQVGT